jgi:hypothetical protein
LFFSSFIIFLWGVTGSQWQSKIWSNFHVKHSWPSHILSANSCRPWSCTEQVSSWMLVYWNLPFSSFSFANLWWYLIWFFFFFLLSHASHFSSRKDSPVLEVELDVEEMAKHHKA